MKLIDAPIGLFKFGNCVALKTEYSTTHGDVCTPDCYIVSSGEYFWGGAKTIEERNALNVTPIKIKHYTVGEGHGEWSLHHIGAGHYWKCSHCGSEELRSRKFCPECGYKMEEEV